MDMPSQYVPIFRKMTKAMMGMVTQVSYLLGVGGLLPSTRNQENQCVKKYSKLRWIRLLVWRVLNSLIYEKKVWSLDRCICAWGKKPHAPNRKESCVTTHTTILCY